MAKKVEEQKLPHEYFPPITFAPAGPDVATQQGNLIQVRQNPAFTYAMALVAEALSRRADIIMLDFTRDAVGVRYSVEGLWMQQPPRDRQSGDAMLFCLKKLANLNPTERRAKQEAKLGVEFLGRKSTIFFTSQGVPTGERIILKFVPKKLPFSSLEDLGMRDKMREQYKQIINTPPGLIVISAPPSGGLTTTWKIGIESADRFIRDFVSAEDKGSTDEEIINVNQYKFDAAAGETPDKILPSMLLKQPDTLVIPEITNVATMKIMCDHVNRDGKMAITRVQAKESAEALLRMLLYKHDPAEVAKAVTMVLNQRLIRKLCDCKQPFQPPPQLLQKLGIPPGRVQVLFREYQPPPPDPKAKDEPPPVCPKCQGVGYFGRTAIFELLVMNDQLREALVKTPKLEVIRQIARQTGTKMIQEEGILLVVKGVTTVNELQRVLQAT